jgi:hypothetical protein
MIIFGGVPIMVIIPPRILANARGMSITEGERFCFTEVLSATGNMSASAPTLFIIAEHIDTTPLKLKI